MSKQNQQQLNLMDTVRIQDSQGRVDQFRSHRAVALLIYLVVQERAVPRSELVELIWPDKPADRGRANLRWSLSYWNKLLPDCWEVTRQTVQFQPGDRCRVDILTLQAALSVRDMAALETAVSLAHGEFCRGFYFDESPEFEAWLLTQREHWRQQLSTAYQKLIDQYRGFGEYGRALTFARKLLDLDAWQENIHRQVMLLRARSGDFTGALAQYETCCQILRDELNISPTEATAALADRIRGWRERPRHNLALQPTPFIGREKELAELTALLAAPDNRLVTIVAAGGMGKTRLALAAAAQQTGAFLDGVAFVSLAPITSPTLLATSVTETLGDAGFIEPHQGHKSATNYLLDALAGRELLLVLDNYEQLLPDVSLLLTILDRAAQVKLLVTSRERLNIRWERPYPLTGLPYPAEDEPAWQSYSAPQLFLQTAQQVHPDFKPGDKDVQAISRICRLVEGMPLALELAATWVRLQQPAAIAAEIAQNVDILHTRQQDLPPRQRSINAVFEQTWARLSPAEQQTLRQLSVFRGPFTVAAASAVTGAGWSLLAALVDKSLLRQREMEDEGDTAVYCDMHELLRQYAAKQLEAQGETALTQQRHGQYYAQLLAAYEPRLSAGDAVAATLQQMRREIDNIRTAWDWALSSRQGDSLNQMLNSIDQFYFLPSLVRDGQAVMAAAAAQLETTPERDAALNLAYGRILARQGAFTWSLHEDYQTAEQLTRRGLAIVEKETSGIEVARVLHMLANIIYQRNLPTAQQYWARSLKIYQELGKHGRQSVLLRNLCVTATTYAEMLHYWEQALETAVSGGDRRNEGHLYFIRGDCEFQVGHIAVGYELAQKSVALIRTIDDPPHLILAMNVLSQILTQQKQFDEARDLLQEMQETAVRLSIEWHSLLVTMANGRFALARGRFSDAETHLDAVIAATSRLGAHDNLQHTALFYQGQLRLAQGNLAAARASWQACLGLKQMPSLSFRSREWRALLGLGETWLCEGVGETAVSYLQQAHEIAYAIGAQAAWQQERARLLEKYGTQLTGIDNLLP